MYKIKENLSKSKILGIMKNLNPYLRFVAKTSHLPNKEFVKAYDCRFLFILSGDGKFITKSSCYDLSENSFMRFSSLILHTSRLPSFSDTMQSSIPITTTFFIPRVFTMQLRVSQNAVSEEPSDTLPLRSFCTWLCSDTQVPKSLQPKLEGNTKISSARSIMA